MMKRLLYILIALTTLSCNKSSQDVSEGEFGAASISIGVDVESSVGMVVRSSSVYELPEELISEDFTLRIVGEYQIVKDGGFYEFDETYDSVEDYNTADVDGTGAAVAPYLYPGTYTATITDNRDSSLESATNAHYAGEKEFEIEARGSGVVEVTLTLQNSVVRVVATDDFRHYFEGGAEITVSTPGGSEIVYTYSKDEQSGEMVESEEQLLFVDAATELSLEGWAIKQPTTGDAGSATTVSFSSSVIETATDKGSMTTVELDAEGVGDVDFTVAVNGEIVLNSDENIELN